MYTIVKTVKDNGKLLQKRKSVYAIFIIYPHLAEKGKYVRNATNEFNLGIKVPINKSSWLCKHGVRLPDPQKFDNQN